MRSEIQKKAYQLGFDAIGFTSDFEPNHKEYFLEWLQKRQHGQMLWLEKNTDKRLKPHTIFEGTRSAIVLLTSYKHDSGSENFSVARYAYGEDYHIWIKKRLKQLGTYIQSELDSGFAYRAFVDTGPVLERDLAAKAGLGWIGKNTCLINKELGSFVFLSVVFVNRDFAASEPVTDHCLNCRLCLDACPTQALEPYRLNASKCLAYHNIEHRGERDQKFAEPLADHLVGCDICQEVCPWNIGAPDSRQVLWQQGFQNFDLTDLKAVLSLDEDSYKHQFKNSAISRISYQDMVRNALIVAMNSKRCDLIETIETWKQDHPDTKLEELELCLAKLKQQKKSHSHTRP